MTKVTKTDQIPEKPHYVVMVYNRSSNGSYSETVSIEHWITEEEDAWKKKLKELYLKDPIRTDVAAFEANVIYKVRMDLILE